MKYTSEYMATINILTVPGREELLKKCLIGLLNQTYTNFQVHIIGHLDTRVIYEFRRNLNIKIIKTNVKGISRKRYLAIKKSNTPFIAFLDDDEIPARQWLEMLIKTLNQFIWKGSRIGAVTGPVITPLFMLLPKVIQKASTINMLLYKLMWYIIYDEKMFYPGKIVYGTPTIGQFTSLYKHGINQVDVFGFGNVLLSKKALDHVNIDPRYNFAYEDYDLALRLRYRGFKILFNPEARVYHIPRLKGLNAVREYSSGIDEGIFLKKYLLLSKNPKTLIKTSFNRSIEMSYRLIQSIKNHEHIYRLLGLIKGLSTNVENWL